MRWWAKLVTATGGILCAPMMIHCFAPRSTIGVTIGAVGQFMMILALDYGPNSWRRSVLEKEYEGEQLEQRLDMKINGGLPMLRALVEMALVNMRPQLSAGDKLPRGLALHPLDQPTTIDLLSISRPGIPLLINFGSCS